MNYEPWPILAGNYIKTRINHCIITVHLL